MGVDTNAVSDLLSIGTRAKSESRSGRAGWALIILLACVAAILATRFLFDWKTRQTAVAFPTSYQAVLLSNGSVYYGKLQGYGTPNPILTQVFYVVTRTDPKTNAVSNILVKRGKELHAPDRMYLNPASIVFVETVGANSKVAGLIAETNGR